jgi:hypothetical protein
MSTVLDHHIDATDPLLGEQAALQDYCCSA